MYSEVDFGCPATIMSPSLPTSTPTESILVASSTSIGGFGACCPNGGNLHFIRSSTSGISIADLREVSSSTACGSRRFRFFNPREPICASSDRTSSPTSPRRPPNWPDERAEIAHCGQEWVGSLAVLLVERLPGPERRHIHADQRRL